MVTTRYRTLVDALFSAPSDRPFVTAWIDEDEQQTVTFGEFRQRAQVQAQSPPQQRNWLLATASS